MPNFSIFVVVQRASKTRYLCRANNLFQQADDELENPVLAGFEWDKEESWTKLIVLSHMELQYAQD